MRNVCAECGVNCAGHETPRSASPDGGPEHGLPPIAEGADNTLIVIWPSSKDTVEQRMCHPSVHVVSATPSTLAARKLTCTERASPQRHASWGSSRPVSPLNAPLRRIGEKSTQTSTITPASRIQEDRRVNEILDFLHARIDEDEAVAKAIHVDRN